MPFYDYACDACGPFTAMRPMSAFSAPTECPSCGAMASRQMSAPQVGASAGGPSATAAAPSHAGGCACCAPSARRRLSAEAV